MEGGRPSAQRRPSGVGRGLRALLLLALVPLGLAVATSCSGDKEPFISGTPSESVAAPDAAPSARAMTTAIAARFGLGAAVGVPVLTVAPGSPAAQAGIRTGDVIVAVDEHALTGVDDLFAAAQRGRGERMQFSVLRNGRRIVVVVIVGDGAER